MNKDSEESDQRRTMRRLEGMGIRVRLLSGGRCVLASMRSDGGPLETLNGSLPVSEFVFATVGVDQIKCLRPQALFVLPLIRVGGCVDAASLEDRIRSTWASYMTTLRGAEGWLRGLGADVNASSTGAILNVALAGERESVKVRVSKARKVILPSRGPLSGIALMCAEDRSLDIDPCVDSAVDLEMIITSRLEELSNLDRRLKDEERRKAMWNPEPSGTAEESAYEQPMRILLVGPRLAVERSCIDSLRLRNYEVEVARNLNEAVRLYDRVSPVLVFADVNLGRSDGIELIASIRRIVGVEEIPVILVDEHRRTTRREAANKAGAIGYLTYPIEIAKIADRLEEMIQRPKRRRFTRYPVRTAVKIHGSSMPSTAMAIGRGGITISTEDQFSINSIQRCDLVLSGLGKRLKFDAEVLYQMNGANQHGVGLRFQSMSARNEVNLIDYLHCLH